MKRYYVLSRIWKRKRPVTGDHTDSRQQTIHYTLETKGEGIEVCKSLSPIHLAFQKAHWHKEK